MPLNDLSLDELCCLSDAIQGLRSAGETLVSHGLTPRFYLNPGWSMGIWTDARMPVDVAEAMAGPWSDPAFPSTEAAQPEPAPEPEETPPAVEGQAGGTLSYDQEDEIDERAFSSAAPSRPEGAIPAPTGAEADSGGGQAVAAAEPPAAQAAAGTHQRGFQAGPSWTAEEDDRLIAILVNLVRLGETKKAAIAIAARDLGRPEAGTAFRCHHKLKPRIDAALTAAAMHQAQTEPAAPEIPASPALAVMAEDGPTASDGDAAGEVRSLPAAPPIEDERAEAAPVKAWHKPEHIADPVTAHLMALTDKGGWTVERDHELMELSIAGWHPNEIGLQLQMQANAIKPRFDALTGQYEDPETGKKVRRFTREDVYAALSRLAGKAA